MDMTLEERERDAYIRGDLATAKLLAELVDCEQELDLLDEMDSGGKVSAIQRARLEAHADGVREGHVKGFEQGRLAGLQEAAVLD